MLLGYWRQGKKQRLFHYFESRSRKIRIQVGCNPEGRLTDCKTGRLQDEYLIFYLKKVDYDNGVKELFNTIVREIYTEYGSSPAEGLAS